MFGKGIELDAVGRQVPNRRGIKAVANLRLRAHWRPQMDKRRIFFCPRAAQLLWELSGTTT